MSIGTSDLTLDVAYDYAHSGNIDGVRGFLNSEEEGLNEFVKDGYTLLHVACMFGHVQLVRFLLDRTALVNVNADNTSAATPLHLAVSYREEDVANDLTLLLLEHGAELNAQQRGGQTPLHHAVGRGSPLLVRTLLGAGADPFLKDDLKRSAAELAKALGDEPHGTEVRELLANVLS